MPKTKGTDVMALRKLLQERGPEFEQAFVAALTPELAELYRTILHFTWTPVEKQTELYAAAAAALYPGHPEPMRELGRAMALQTFSGIYKIFLRLPTMSFIMSRTAQMWQTYYDAGEASVENFTGKTGTLLVRKFPELPRKMREVVCGHLQVLIEATGAKHVRVQLLDSDPNAWRWEIHFS
jgi:hypothetical protein